MQNLRKITGLNTANKKRCKLYVGLKGTKETCDL